MHIHLVATEFFFSHSRYACFKAYTLPKPATQYSKRKTGEEADYSAARIESCSIDWPPLYRRHDALKILCATENSLVIKVIHRGCYYT